MPEINGVNRASVNYKERNRLIEKKVHQINNMATGITGAGIVVATAGAATVIHYADKKNTFLNKAVTKLSKKTGETKTELLKNNFIKEIAKGYNYVSEKSNKFLEKAENKFLKLPRTVRVASIVAFGLLAISHIYRKGQIDGAFTTVNVTNDFCQKAYKKGYHDGEANAEAKYADKIEEKDSKKE